MVDIPDVVRKKARAVGADAWVDELPALVASLETEWQIAVGRAYRDSTEAYVAEATLADGTPAVLKLLVPRDGDAAAHEATVLRIAAGEGCAGCPVKTSREAPSCSSGWAARSTSFSCRSIDGTRSSS